MLYLCSWINILQQPFQTHFAEAADLQKAGLTESITLLQSSRCSATITLSNRV